MEKVEFALFDKRGEFLSTIAREVPSSEGVIKSYAYYLLVAGSDVFQVKWFIDNENKGVVNIPQREIKSVTVELFDKDDNIIKNIEKEIWADDVEVWRNSLDKYLKVDDVMRVTWYLGDVFQYGLFNHKNSE